MAYDPIARLDSEYGIEIADNLNQQLAGSDYKFMYIVHDGVYLVIEDDDGRWSVDAEFDQAGLASDIWEHTDRLANKIDTKLADIPGTNTKRVLITESE